MAIKIKNKGERDPEESDQEGGQPGGAPPGDAPGSNLDGFERASFMAAAWIENNRRLFFALVGVALLAVGAALVSFLYIRSQQIEASERLSEGLADYEQLVEGSPEYEALQAQDDVPVPDAVFESTTERWDAVYDSADRTLADFEGGAITNTARLSKAAAALNLEKYEESEQLYRDVVESDDASDEYRAKAYVGLANSLAAQNNLEGADEAWDGFVELMPERRAYADFEMARMVERFGDEEEATRRYSEFLEEHEDSEHVEEVERRKALL